MFWLLEKDIRESYNFIQIFELNEFSIDSDTIYTLDSNVFPIISGINYSNIIKEKNILPFVITYCIKIIGNNISYTDLSDNKTISFIKEEKFINPSNNKFNKPIFDINYKLVQKDKMPELKSTSYDFYYPNIKFELFQINLNLILVKEYNLLNETNSVKNYIIAKKN